MVKYDQYYGHCVQSENNMAAKKYYAVKCGKTEGIFDNWADCKASVDGFPGADYKGFSTLQEAKDYMGLAAEKEAPVPDLDHLTDAKWETVGNKAYYIPKASDKLIAYVDGSYEDSVKRYAFGCVFLLPDGRIYTQCGSGNKEQSLQHRNVTGEMLGAMYAVRAAQMSGYRKVQICYDYEGIEKWVTGVWKAKQELTAMYAENMKQWSRMIEITFTKVAAHTNVEFNELADKTAKMGLTEPLGVPKVMRIEDMTPWNQ